MAIGKIRPRGNMLANIQSEGVISDHNRLLNRDKLDQHPIEAITDLRQTLDNLDDNIKDSVNELKTELVEVLDKKLEDEIERATEADAKEKERAEEAEKKISSDLAEEVKRAEGVETQIMERVDTAEDNIETLQNDKLDRANFANDGLSHAYIIDSNGNDTTAPIQSGRYYWDNQEIDSIVARDSYGTIYSFGLNAYDIEAENVYSKNLEVDEKLKADNVESHQISASEFYADTIKALTTDYSEPKKDKITLGNTVLPNISPNSLIKEDIENWKRIGGINLGSSEYPFGEIHAQSLTVDSLNGSQIDDISSDISNEIARAKQAEQALDTKITQEIEDRRTDIGEVFSSLGAEENFREEADKNLQAAIDAVKKAEEEHSIDLTAKITTEKTEREAAISAEVEARTNAVDTLTTNINSEIKRAKDAEKVLTNSVSDEITRAKAAEEQLSQALTTEVNTINNTTDSLSSRISDAETSLDNKLEKAPYDPDSYDNGPKAYIIDAEGNNTTLNIYTGNSGSNEDSYISSIVARDSMNGIKVGDIGASHVNAISLVSDSLQTASISYNYCGIMYGDISIYNTLVPDGSQFGGEVNLGSSDFPFGKVYTSELYADNIESVTITNLNNTISSEITRATEAEEVLTDAIEDEKSARDTAISTVTNNLTAEVARAKKAESDNKKTLQDNITAEETARIEAINTLQTNVDNEVKARKAKDTELQTAITEESTTRATEDTAIKNRLSSIEAKIPNDSSSTNKLADKQFVNSAVSTNTAYFKGTFDSITDLPTESITNNDYAFIKIIDDITGQIKQYDRYKYNASDNEWIFEYTLNNSSFTADQWAAVQSGITEDLVEKITTNETNINTQTTNLSNLTKSFNTHKSDIEAKVNTEIDDRVAAVTAETTARTTAISTLDTNKLDKVITETTNDQVYAKTAAGEQDMLDISSSNTASTLAKRDNKGELVVSTPTTDNSATTKKYVDDNFLKVLGNGKITGKLTTTDTLTAPVANLTKIHTGEAEASYFQTRRLRGQGTAVDYYHAIDFGYQTHNQVDFYEFGGLWNFWQNQSPEKTTNIANRALSIQLDKICNKGHAFTWPNKSGTFALLDDIPTIHDWAKADKKPTYTHEEVGAEKAFTKKTAFNKDFAGTGTADTVAKSDHNHNDLYETIDNADTIRTRITTIENDYLKASDKTDLQNQITTSISTLETSIDNNLATKEELTAAQTSNAATYEVLTNKVTTISNSSTDDQYPTAKLLYSLLPKVIR